MGEIRGEAFTARLGGVDQDVGVQHHESLPAWQRPVLADFPLPCHGILDVAVGIEFPDSGEIRHALRDHLGCRDELPAFRLCLDLTGLDRVRSSLHICFHLHFAVAEFRRERQVQRAVGVGFEDRGDRAHAAEASGIRGKRKAHAGAEDCTDLITAYPLEPK